MKKLFWLCFCLLLLVACRNTANSNETENKQETSPAKEAVEEQETVATPASPASCEGILFEQGAVIEGKKLAACMKDAMIAAGSGSHKVNSASGASKVDFQWNPDFSMHIENSDNTVIIDGDTGWMKTPETGWIEETDEPSNGEEVIASNVIKLTRILGHPIAIAENFAQAPTWKVVGQGAVPDTEAFVDTAWHLTPEQPIHLNGAMLTDVQLWITDHYLGAYYIATATIAGLSETTSNTFLQWGEPVDIPSPN